MNYKILAVVRDDESVLYLRCFDCDAKLNDILSMNDYDKIVDFIDGAISSN